MRNFLKYRFYYFSKGITIFPQNHDKLILNNLIMVSIGKSETRGRGETERRNFLRFYD